MILGYKSHIILLCLVYNKCTVWVNCLFLCAFRESQMLYSPHCILIIHLVVRHSSQKVYVTQFPKFFQPTPNFSPPFITSPSS